MIIPGMVYGKIADIRDPLLEGRAKVAVPGIFPNGTPYWCNPAGWAGGGRDLTGAFIPPELGQQVILIFERGNTESGASYIPSMYGEGHKDDGVTKRKAGPMWARDAADPMRRTTLWEDRSFVVAVQRTDSGPEVVFDEETKRPRMQDGRKLLMLIGKRQEAGVEPTGIVIMIDGGPSGNSNAVSIKAQTALFLKSSGHVVIEAPVVTINGRRVMKSGGSI